MALIKGNEIADRIARGQRLVGDGAMGTALMQAGVRPDEILDANRTCPDLVRGVHESYLRAGADILSSNTFGIWNHHEREQIVRQGLQIAIECAQNCTRDIGVVCSVIPAMVIGGFESIRELSHDPTLWPDAMLIETCTSLDQTLTAIEMLRRIQPVLLVVTCHFNRQGIMLDGTSPQTAAQSLLQAGADVVGANCGDDPDGLIEAIREMRDVTHSPLYVQPSAGIPVKTHSGPGDYPVGPKQFGTVASRLYSMGVSVVGGCCGTTARHIEAVKASCASA